MANETPTEFAVLLTTFSGLFTGIVVYVRALQVQVRNKSKELDDQHKQLLKERELKLSAVNKLARIEVQLQLCGEESDRRGNEIISLREINSSLTQQVGDVWTRVGELSFTMDTYSDNLAKVTANYDTLGEKFNELEDINKKLRIENQVLISRIQALTEERDKLFHEKEKLALENEQLNERIKQLQTQLDENTQALRKNTELLEHLQASVKVDSNANDETSTTSD